MLPPTKAPQPPRYDRTLFEAALSYYGLPPDWPRLFTPVAGRDTKTGKAAGLLPTTLEGASRVGGPLWVQINEPCPGLAEGRVGRPKKARVGEIVLVRNVTLDFEYPACPPLAHAVGSALAYRLIERGLAAPGLAVEDSGGGCHIVIPIRPIVTAQVEGGARRVNEAVKMVVAHYIEPLFEGLTQGYGLAGQMHLEGYDLAHLLSAPGSWRPSTKAADCPSLRGGFLRRWLPPHDRVSPVRRESGNLTKVIVATAARLRLRLRPGQTGPLADADSRSALKIPRVRGTVLSFPLTITSTSTARPTHRYALAALASEAGRVHFAPVGQGNNTLNLAAFRLGQLVAIGLIECAQVEETLLEAATAGGRRSRREAQMTIRSGLGAGLNAARH